MLLAIETSCDETALTVFDWKAYLAGTPALACIRHEIICSQAQIHAPYGGVVPELAAREHLANLSPLLERSLSAAGMDEAGLSAVAVTEGPGLKGSLLTGIAFAKAYALRLRVPLIPVHHIEAHLLSGLIPCPAFLDGTRTVALVVSGGHTELYAVDGFRCYRRLAKTRDDAAGEAFDKSATLLGLPYPGGPQLAKLAELGDSSRYRVSEGVPRDAESFSFSGLKTAVSRLVAEAGGGDNPNWRADVAAACQNAIVHSLVNKSSAAVRAEGAKRFLLCGGVAANTELRRALSHQLGMLGCEFVVPSNLHCTDNATMIAACAAETVRNYGIARFDMTTSKSLSSMAARARYPLVELVAAANGA